MAKLPPNNRWTQINSSDKVGSIYASKNINLDEEGYLKLSPRTILIANRDDDTSLGSAHLIGRFNTGEYIIATSDSNYNINRTLTGDPTPAINTGASAPAGANQGGAVFWQNLWLATTDTAVLSRAISASASAAWTSRITGLTSGVPHRLAVFANRNELVVTNGNVAKQYNTLYSNTTDLTISSDFIMNGVAYNGRRVGIITRLGSATVGQNAEALFYIWDGATTEANDGRAVGSEECMGICAYKSSFAILTRAGQLLYYNGGGFDVLANLPIYNQKKYFFGGFINPQTTGVNMVSDGERIFIHTTNTLLAHGRNDEDAMENFPGGVWCFDPRAGLYHRSSQTFSKFYRHAIAAANVNTTTDVFTTSATIPDTGNIARLIRFSSAAKTFGGLRVNTDYYVIKVSSTTFKLATSKDNAIIGTAVDVTSADTTTYFHLFDIVDYASTKVDAGNAAAIALTGENDAIKTGIILGGSTYKLDMSGTQRTLSINVPWLENRGWIITPKIFSSQVQDTAQKMFVKWRPLKSGDSIIIKSRHEEALGLPISSTTLQHANWLGTNNFSTAQNLADAKTYLDAGGILEIEFLAGAGAGQAVKVNTISTDDNITYSVEVDENVIGAQAGRKSAFIINNWEVRRTISSSEKGFAEIPLGKTGKFHQFKIELRGDETTIEEIDYVNAVQQKSL